jgi:hypothetical protein
MPGSPQWSLSLRFPHENLVHASTLPHTHYMPHPSHSSRFHHPHNNGWGVQMIKLLIKIMTADDRATTGTIWPLTAANTSALCHHSLMLHQNDLNPYK